MRESNAKIDLRLLLSMHGHIASAEMQLDHVDEVPYHHDLAKATHELEQLVLTSIGAMVVYNSATLLKKSAWGTG